MSGILRGSIEHYIASAIASANSGVRDAFAVIVRFFDAHPQMTRIASQAGSGYVGTQSLALPGYTSDPNRSGDNAFGVWRWDKANGSKLYILLQYSYGPVVGTAPGNPGATNNNYGVAIAIAADTSGGNPWNGGTANLGADTKGATVWVPNGGTLVVWPRANGVDGVGATTKHWMCQVAMYSSGNPQRLHVMTDDDAMWVMFDQTNVGGYYNVFFFGPYTARTGVTPTTNFNLAMYEGYSKSGTAASWTTGAGTTSGTTADEGGIVIDAANGPKTFFWSSVQALDSALMQPNLVVGESDRLDVFLRVADASVPSQYGLVGKIDPSLLAFVSNVPTLTTNAAKTVAVFGSSNVSHTKYLVPWDGVTVPGSGATLAGVQFP